MRDSIKDVILGIFFLVGVAMLVIGGVCGFPHWNGWTGVVSTVGAIMVALVLVLMNVTEGGD